MSTDTPKTPGDPEQTGQSAGSSSIGQTTQPSQDRGGQNRGGQSQAKTEEMRERAREVQDRIEEGYNELEQRYDDARVQLRQANDTAVSFIRENPALCIVGAVGIGYFVGRLASRRWLT